MELEIVAICGHPELYDTTSYLYRDQTKKKEVGLPGKLWKYLSVT